MNRETIRGEVEALMVVVFGSLLNNKRPALVIDTPWQGFTKRLSGVENE